jgi:hypothetical protein
MVIWCDLNEMKRNRHSVSVYVTQIIPPRSRHAAERRRNRRHAREAVLRRWRLRLRGSPQRAPRRRPRPHPCAAQHRTTAEAARTSVLSRRWPRVWHLLPELRFSHVPDGHRIREVLAAPDAPPPLRLIFAFTGDSTPDTLGAWLPDAARRLSGDLFYFNTTWKDDEEEEDGQAGETGAVQLPFFEKATGIALTLGFLGTGPLFAIGRHVRLPRQARTRSRPTPWPM